MDKELEIFNRKRRLWVKEQKRLLDEKYRPVKTDEDIDGGVIIYDQDQHKEDKETSYTRIVEALAEKENDENE